MIRTKIVATIGPATSQVDTLARLFAEGADICRLNFSHGNLDEHAAMLTAVRQAAQRQGCHMGILGDLGGPKIRLGQVADADGSGGMPIEIGQTLIIQRQPIVGVAGRVSANYPRFVDDVAVGDRVLIEDGLLRFVITDKSADEVVAACTAGGILRSAKGINLPNTQLNIPSITEKDWACADWAVDNGLDFLALSFVRRADDLHELRRHLRGRGSDIHLIAKIEKPEALGQIDAILAACDGLMVARGDLGVEMDVAQVPIVQKDLIRRCQLAGKPVIVATQMLQSMIEQASPTRAEVSDVANAIFDGADAVMLSGETSVGKYPLAAVHIMNHVAEVTEAYLASIDGIRQPVVHPTTADLSIALGHAVWEIVHDLKARMVALWSQTGATAQAFSKFHMPVPIIAFSSNPKVLRQMAIHYGVIAQEMSSPADVGLLVEQVDRLVRHQRLAEPGDRIVIVAGSAMGTPGTMNGIMIHTVGEPASVAPRGADPAQSQAGASR